jgi:hypothetical protein
MGDGGQRPHTSQLTSDIHFRVYSRIHAGRANHEEIAEDGVDRQFGTGLTRLPAVDLLTMGANPSGVSRY